MPPQAEYPALCDGIPGGTGTAPRPHGQAGVHQQSAFVRKMALNGYILHVDLSPVLELVSLQRRCSSNLNQVAIHANTYSVYPDRLPGFNRTTPSCGGA